MSIFVEILGLKMKAREEVDAEAFTIFISNGLLNFIIANDGS